MCKTLRQADCRDRLAFSGSGGGGRRDQDDLAAPLERGIGEELKPDLALKSHLVNATWKSIRGVKNLTGSGRDADGPGRAGRHRARSGGRLIADGRAGIGRSSHVDGELPKKFPSRVENLDAAVAAVGDIDMVMRIYCDAVRRVELARSATGLA